MEKINEKIAIYEKDLGFLDKKFYSNSIEKEKLEGEIEIILAELNITDEEFENLNRGENNENEHNEHDVNLVDDEYNNNNINNNELQNSKTTNKINNGELIELDLENKESDKKIDFV
jgi:hypothetical protein